MGEVKADMDEMMYFKCFSFFLCHLCDEFSNLVNDNFNLFHSHLDR